jgi:hypothetical protein
MIVRLQILRLENFPAFDDAPFGSRLSSLGSCLSVLASGTHLSLLPAGRQVSPLRLNIPPQKVSTSSQKLNLPRHFQ